MKPYNYPAQIVFQTKIMGRTFKELDSTDKKYIAEKTQKLMDGLLDQLKQNNLIGTATNDGQLTHEIFLDKSSSYFHKIKTTIVISILGYDWCGPECPSMDEQMERPDFCTKAIYWKKI